MKSLARLCVVLTVLLICGSVTGCTVKEPRKPSLIVTDQLLLARTFVVSEGEPGEQISCSCGIVTCKDSTEESPNPLGPGLLTLAGILLQFLLG